MSKNRDEIHDENLKSFLQHLKSKNQDDLDDFDKDALEGFAMLKDEKEALELKTGLDRKMHSGILASKEKQLKKYWYAAAGIFVILSFGAYFYLKNNLNPEQKNLAISNTTKKETLPESATTPATQPETIAKTILPATPPTEASGNTKKKYKVIYQNTEDLITQSGSKEDSKSTKSEEADIDIKPVLAAAEQKAEEAENNTLEEPKQNNGLTAKEPESKKRAETNIRQQDKADAFAINKAKKARERKNADDMDVNFTMPAAPQTVTPDDDLGVSTYRGGQEAFQKDLRKLMEDASISKGFDAVLLINREKKIDSVVFISGNLKTKDQKQITDILKTLTNFELSQEQASVKLYEYRFSYKP